MTRENPASRRQLKRERTRQRIMDEAGALFLEKGYERTSVEEISDAAAVSPRTFYAYFDSKVDVAIPQFATWTEDFCAAMEARPPDETPDQMVVRALDDLRRQGYNTSSKLFSAGGERRRPLSVGVRAAATSDEVAGRIFRALLATQDRMTELFRTRLQCPPGTAEPRMLAAALTASWYVGIYGFDDVSEHDADPPTSDGLSIAAFAHYSAGLAALWRDRDAPEPPPPTE